MESLTKSVAPSNLAGASGDEITSKEEPEIAEPSIEEDGLGPEFSPNWRFYLAFASLAVVTLAVCMFSDGHVSVSHLRAPRDH
jgi:hypothetical protein